MHAFIVRPFGIKNGIDFERVERELIRPALAALNISGGTTGEFIQQGNIRTDMFEQLLIADLVVADISIHNANAFYELGIRHAFREKRTFLIKSQADEVPFDLKTDRYMPYDADDPAASLPALIDALKKTLDSQNQDSPVFQLLPELEPADPTKFLGVPLDFKEEVRRAESSKNTGYLQMLSAEADGFAWTTMGLRLIGKAQFKLKDWQGARATWEAVRKYEDTDLAANTFLGTVYQRLGDLVRSDQALQRALQDRDMSRSDRAELWALMARNAKILWEANWKQVTGVDEIQREALASPHLKRSFELYCKGFTEDRNHFYSGLNALAMLTIMTELAVAQPEIWQDDYDSTEEAGLQLRKLTELRLDLAGGIRLAIESRREALACKDQTDIWAEISGADLIMLRSSKPKRVGRAYKTALAGAPDIASDSARQQLLHYQTLGILTENTRAALDNIPVVKQKQETPETAPHVILFTGHRIDAPDRRKPRFPHQKENQARDMILAAVSQVKETATGQLLGISGGASGGDILFHEICEELEIPTKMYLAIPKQKYIKASVAEGGFKWVERFNRLFEEKQPEILSASGELPRWQHARKNYSIWQRANMWMLHSAMAISNNNLILIALWNSETGDGAGGTEDMVQRAQDLGTPLIHISARMLVE
jgi:hypothetical protein